MEIQFKGKLWSASVEMDDEVVQIGEAVIEIDKNRRSEFLTVSVGVKLIASLLPHVGAAV